MSSKMLQDLVHRVWIVGNKISVFIKKKIPAEINEKVMKETIIKINKTKSWFFEKIKKTGKPLVRLIKKK